MKHDEYHRQFADRVIEQIRQGTAPWQKPWGPGERVLPREPRYRTLLHGRKQPAFWPPSSRRAATRTCAGAPTARLRSKAARCARASRALTSSPSRTTGRSPSTTSAGGPSGTTKASGGDGGRLGTRPRGRRGDGHDQGEGRRCRGDLRDHGAPTCRTDIDCDLAGHGAVRRLGPREGGRDRTRSVRPGTVRSADLMGGFRWRWAGGNRSDALRRAKCDDSERDTARRRRVDQAGRISRSTCRHKRRVRARSAVPD